MEDDLAASRKVAVIPVIKIADGIMLMVESVLGTVGRKCQVEELHLFSFVIPRTTSVALLSQAATNVRMCEIWDGQPGQVEAILTAVSEAPDIALETLHIQRRKVEAQISPDILASAAVKLRSLEVDRPNSDQAGAILTRLADTVDSKLRKLVLSDFPRVGFFGETEVKHQRLLRVLKKLWIFFPDVELEASLELYEAAKVNNVLEIHPE